LVKLVEAVSVCNVAIIPCHCYSAKFSCLCHKHNNTFWHNVSVWHTIDCIRLVHTRTLLSKCFVHLCSAIFMWVPRIFQNKSRAELYSSTPPNVNRCNLSPIRSYVLRTIE
jgi:hypothetical protein